MTNPPNAKILKDGKSVRLLCRTNELQEPTCGMAPGYEQTNLVILPKKYAFDFLLFCTRNAQACPLIEVIESGNTAAVYSAPDADLRFDLPKYCVYEHGELVATPTSVEDRWQEDFVSFLLGCSFSFDSALQNAGLPVRHIEEQVNVPMYVTNRACNSAGVFKGPLVVSMRPMLPTQAIRAVEVTSRFTKSHGAPVYWGNPEEIGIKDLWKPDYGDSVSIHESEIPVFWACGVTPQQAILNAKPEIAITHAPGHMFLTDLPSSLV